MRLRSCCFLAPLAAIFGCGSSATASHASHIDASSSDVAASDVSVTDASDASLGVGLQGGTVDLLQFGVFGDVRPPDNNQTANYPSSVVASVMDGLTASGAQFAIASGDYVYANDSMDATMQLGLLLTAAQRFPNSIFWALGNHDCDTATASNCSTTSTYPAWLAYRGMLTPSFAQPYFDFVVHTSLGDAHFVVTAPNAWSADQQTWLLAALAQSARYTIVAAHETSDDPAPGTILIEAAIAARVGGVTLRMYGHFHEYQHLSANAVICGNAGAPLNDGQTTYGFGIVSQRADGNLVFTAYNVGTPPMPVDSFVLAPDGTLSM